MKNWNENPWVWTIIVLILSYFIIGDNRGFEGLVMLILAFILGKQIEIINLIKKDKSE
ncbi:MAG: hypothetical protein V4486_01435 [Patescibacteria group bacterium]